MPDAPSSSPNQRLAERIGRLRAENASLEALRALDDELASVLLDYRRALDDEAVAPSPDTSRRLWDRIEAEMEPAGGASSRSRRPDRAPVRAASRSVAGRIAVGVGLLLLVGLVAWWAWPEAGRGLVAEAGAASATYETAAGDVVRLRPHSRLYRTRDDAPHFRLEGEALFDVTPRPDAPFTVEAGAAVVRVLGTRFTVQTWTPRPTVFLAEGRVELRNAATGETAALRPGEAGTLALDGRVDVRRARADAYLDWLDGELAFDSEPASVVAAELEQHFGIRIALPDSVAAQTLTGRLLLDRRTRALSDFGRVLGGRFERRDDTFRFRRD